MDVISHGLWSAAIAKGSNLKYKKNYKPGWAAFWGMLPDILPFASLWAWLAYQKFFGNFAVGSFKPSYYPPAIRESLPIFRLSEILYSLSHSLIIFMVIMALIYLFKRRIYPEMTAWLFHIIVDIPTHSLEVYPTPFLWPISDWKFNGFYWGHLNFILSNYFLLIIAYILLYFYFRKKKSTLKISNFD